MISMSRVPLVPAMHRLAMFSIRRSGVGRERLFGLYRRAWARMGRFQQRVTDRGVKLECDIGDRIPEFIFHFGHWEPNISYWIARRLEPGRIFVDVGANIGYYSLMASTIVGPGGGVVAVEASPRIHQRLLRHVQLNHLRNVRTINAAVSDRSTRLTVFAGPDANSGATSTLESWRHGTPEAEVDAQPLYKLLTESELQKVRLIKIDVEGGEAPILANLVNNMDRFPADVEIVVECSRSTDEDAWVEIFSQFSGRGFHAFHIENEYTAQWYLNWRAPCGLKRITSLPLGQTDVLFTRDVNAGC